MKQYDVVVLGAGPGGYVTAIRVAQLGGSVAIIEKENVGGTCLNVGCIPTKALIKNVEILHSIEMGKKRGIKIDGEIVLDYEKAVKAKDSAVRQLVSGVKSLLASNGVDFYQGMGRVEADSIISIESPEGTEQIQYSKLIIATGSSPKVPPIPGAEAEGVMTSETLLVEKTVPANLTIIGGGVIGCEFASIFKAYGSKVTIVEMLPDVVAMLDGDVSSYMRDMLLDQGMDLKLGVQVKEIIKPENGELDVVVVDKEGKEESLKSDKVLISIGRKPNTAGLENLNLEMDRGFVVVNDRLETSAPGVYAIGDVTGKKQLAHVASDMGIIAAENAMGASKKMDLEIVPSCIYTIPEVGSVGLSEREAREKGYEILVGKFPLVACGKAVATGEPEGVFKIIANKADRKILGAHLIGKSATEVIAEMAAYMKMNATIDHITETIHAHPTISESIAEAARNVDGCTIHMPKQK